jgi:hypothetical protein
MVKTAKATAKALDKASIKATAETSIIIDKQVTTNNITATDVATVSKKFTRPTLEQVKKYCDGRQN